ncbi:MAG: L-threonylcarbamoyladenylate synthase [Thermodesulfobacteriota bacterium]
MNKKAKILSPETDKSAETAAEILKSGGVIIYPTETLYGIGTFATNINGNNKIFEIKKRALGKPLLTLVKDTDMISKYFQISDEQVQLYKKYNEFPLTIILKQKFSFPDELSAGTRKIGARISSNRFVNELFHHIEVPLVSTSANISDQGNAEDISEIINQFVNKVDLIIDSGNLPDSKGSTVLDLTTKPPSIVREGDIGEKELKEFLIGNNQGI